MGCSAWNWRYSLPIALSGLSAIGFRILCMFKARPILDAFIQRVAPGKNTSIPNVTLVRVLILFLNIIGSIAQKNAMLKTVEYPYA